MLLGPKVEEVTGASVNCIIANSMELSPSIEAARSSASQQIPSIFWNQKVRYRVRKHPPHFPILSHINLVHAFSSLLLEDPL
jgi:hypothetical protein